MENRGQRKSTRAADEDIIGGSRRSIEPHARKAIRTLCIRNEGVVRDGGIEPEAVVTVAEHRVGQQDIPAGGVHVDADIVIPIDPVEHDQVAAAHAILDLEAEARISEAVI